MILALPSQEVDQKEAIDTATLGEDEALMERLQQGDADALTQLSKKYERELYSYLRRYMDDATLAEDVAQNTWLKVWGRREQFHCDQLFRPWLYAIATNDAIDQQRREKRHRIVHIDQKHATAESPDGMMTLAALLCGRNELLDGMMEQKDENVRLEKMVEALPDPLRAVVILVYYRELKYREAAEILGIPSGTVKSRLHIAILKLHERYEELVRCSGEDLGDNLLVEGRLAHDSSDVVIAPTIPMNRKGDGRKKRRKKPKEILLVDVA